MSWCLFVNYRNGFDHVFQLFFSCMRKNALNQYIALHPVSVVKAVGALYQQFLNFQAKGSGHPSNPTGQCGDIMSSREMMFVCPLLSVMDHDSMSTQLSSATILNKALTHHSRRALASLLDVTPKTIARWERGEVPLKNVHTLALRQIVSETRQNNRNRSSRKRNSEEFTFIDLFAGIGGTRLGLETVGGRCIWTSEWDRFSQQTYAANFCDDHTIAGDITNVEAEEIPDHDVLVGGFPCQPFSIAGVSKKNALGTPHGFECKKQGNLFFDIARIIDHCRPKAFVLENVKNLERHDKGRTFAVIRQTLEEELGYHISFRVIDAKHFLPQHRERIFIVGFREKTGFDWQKLELPSVDEGPRLASILHPQDGSEESEEPYTTGKKAKVSSKYVLTDHLWDYLQRYAEKHRAKGNGFGFGLVGKNDIARTLSARYYKDGSEILIRRGGRGNPRRLTPRECARLMGFSDDFQIPVSDTQAYRQFGNSVAVPVVKAVARAAKPYFMPLIQDSKASRSPQQTLF
jgi:DNA (cytosine-5)-methyltransferase 1